MIDYNLFGGLDVPAGINLVQWDYPSSSTVKQINRPPWTAKPSMSALYLREFRGIMRVNVSQTSTEGFKYMVKTLPSISWISKNASSHQLGNM